MLGCGEEGQGFESGLGPRSKWVPIFESEKHKAAKGVDGFCLSYTVPKIQWPLTPTAPMATKRWETFTFTFYFETEATETVFQLLTSTYLRQTIRFQ